MQLKTELELQKMKNCSMLLEPPADNIVPNLIDENLYLRQMLTTISKIIDTGDDLTNINDEIKQKLSL